MYIAFLLFVVSLNSVIAKQRIVISSDFPPLDVIPGGAAYGPDEKRSDPDDIQSMVRFLVYANEFKVEGLIASCATLAWIADKQNMFDIIDLYDQVDDNLRLHDPKYPTAAALRKVTYQGLSGTYGKPADQIIGKDKDSEASEFIINLVDNNNPDPIWFCFWGGSQELAQAFWKVQNTRSAGDIEKFISKIRVYLIAQQDGSAQWMKEQFPNLFVIVSHKSFYGMFYNQPEADQKIANIDWLNTNVRSKHGPLGAVYPESGWNPNNKGVIEGDSPSFLYVLCSMLGLSDPEKPWFGGWGGRFQANTMNKKHWFDSEEGTWAVTRWQYARQNNFAARMDWCVQNYSNANHNPVAVINGDNTLNILYLTAVPRQTVTLNAEGSFDPDGNSLSYRWWQYNEADSYEGSIKLENSTQKHTSFVVPSDFGLKTIHIILEITDNGTPNLTSYRRIVVKGYIP